MLRGCGETTAITLIVFDLIRPGREPTIYDTRGEHAKYYAIAFKWRYVHEKKISLHLI